MTCFHNYYKVCCFFGHRNTTLTTQQYDKLKNTIEDLIVKHNIKFFYLVVEVILILFVIK